MTHTRHDVDAVVVITNTISFATAVLLCSFLRSLGLIFSTYFVQLNSYVRKFYNIDALNVQS